MFVDYRLYHLLMIPEHIARYKNTLFFDGSPRNPGKSRDLTPDYRLFPGGFPSLNQGWNPKGSFHAPAIEVIISHVRIM